MHGGDSLGDGILRLEANVQRQDKLTERRDSSGDSTQLLKKKNNQRYKTNTRAKGNLNASGQSSNHIQI